MGQANHRGTFEQRRTHAIERDKVLNEALAKKRMEISDMAKDMSLSQKMFLASVFAMAEQTRKMGYRR